MGNFLHAPVLIHTLCRYEHFKRCLESLSRCTGADETEVFIGLDYPAKDVHRSGYEKIRDYLDNCGNLGFKALHVIKRPHNYGFGPNGNAMSLRRDVFKDYDTIIVSEDDNEFAPAFLDFMNQALTKYKYDERVRSVGAWLSPHEQQVKGKNVQFTYSTSAWGLGLWKHKELVEYDYSDILRNKAKSWKLFTASPACWVLFYRMVKRGISYGDIKRETFNRMNNSFQVRPYISLVRNWGNDGSGANCVADNDRFVSASILDSKTFGELDDSEVKLSVSRTAMFFYNLPPRNTLRCWLVLGKYTFIYLKSLFH